MQPNFVLAKSVPSGEVKSFFVDFSDTGSIHYSAENNTCTITSEDSDESFKSSLKECFSLVPVDRELRVHGPLTIFISRLTIFLLFTLILHIIYSSIPGRIFGVD